MPNLEEFLNFNNQEREDFLKAYFDEYSTDTKSIEEPYLETIIDRINSDLDVSTPITFDEVITKKIENDCSKKICMSDMKMPRMKVIKGPKLISYDEYLSYSDPIYEMILEKNL